MIRQFSRREWMAGLLPVMVAARVGGRAPAQSKDLDATVAQLAFLAIERRVGGRLGVAALDTASSKRLDYHASDRFALCSTFKLLAAAATLARVDRGLDHLDRVVRYGVDDLLDYAPITSQHVAEGGMTVEALLAAALQYSDNTAGNLLLSRLDGPAGLTKYVRSLGDLVTRLDRTEPTLNEANPGDPRDTTTPEAMVADMRRLLVAADSLSSSSRQRLLDWMTGNTTGSKRLRSGVPASWRAGDKTGSGSNGATNDIAIVWPSGRPPVLIAAYLTESSASSDDRESALADVGRLVVSILGR